eukprot:6421902-Prymnesium_polylepis.1
MKAMQQPKNKTAERRMRPFILDEKRMPITLPPMYMIVPVPGRSESTADSCVSWAIASMSTASAPSTQVLAMRHRLSMTAVKPTADARDAIGPTRGVFSLAAGVDPSMVHTGLDGPK